MLWWRGPIFLGLRKKKLEKIGDLSQNNIPAPWSPTWLTNTWAGKTVALHMFHQHTDEGHITVWISKEAVFANYYPIYKIITI